MSNYGIENIKILDSRDAVRTRIGMYLGNSKEGYHHAIWEIIDNSNDEHLNGYGDLIKIIVLEDGAIQIEDKGRGIPFDIHPKTGLNGIETIFTNLHAGGKFDKDNYKVSGGLNGVGATCTNFCSEYFTVRSSRGKKVALQKFVNGAIEDPIKIVNKEEETGTVIRFKLNGSIFKYDGGPDIELIKERCEVTSYLNPGLTLSVKDLRTKKSIDYHSENGLDDYLYNLSGGQEITSPISISETYVDDNEDFLISIDCGVLFVKGSRDSIKSYANLVPTNNGGTHVNGFKAGFVDAINEMLLANKIMGKDEEPFKYREISDGLVAVVAVKVPDPQFVGQTKDKLDNSDVRDLVYDCVFESYCSLFKKSKKNESYEDNLEMLKKIYTRVSLARKADEAADRARKAVVSKGSSVFDTKLPGKLADCHKGAEYTEMYIVEGDSAGGSMKQGRNSKFQAILPLRGKILNVEEKSFDSVIASQGISIIMDSIGCGIVPMCDPSKSRYDKIIICTDADVDGAHIATLLITYFYRYMKPLIDAGMLYIARPPLYKISYGARAKKLSYAYNDTELNEFLDNLKKQDVPYNIQRYKGLGEMNPSQLWETVLDPESRTIEKLVLNSISELDEITNSLMGKYPELRKDFIFNSAKFANIDA